jgi:undecaprenyl-phosphate 4-deoxy-4-formamido-L-arabinose transferase
MANRIGPAEKYGRYPSFDLPLTRYRQATELTVLARRSVSIVVPVHNSAITLPELVRRLDAVLPAIANAFEVILIDDGSRDASAAVARELIAGRPHVRMLRLLRNYGQHNALLCGIRHARYDVIVTMDDDLQHPPEQIVRLLDRIGDDCELAYGSPAHEQHGLWRDLASQLTKLVMQQVLSVEMARKVSGFRAFDRRLVSAFDDFKGPFVNLDVMLTWGTTKIDGVIVPHDPRAHGTSHYRFRQLLRHAVNMLTGFSVLPLRVASLLGLLLTIFGAGALAYVLGRYALQGSPVPGFPFLASIIIVFSGTQLFVLGVMGEYLARMHFRLLGRPAYTVRESHEGTAS